MRIVILAGGQAERFNGISKEMLPCGENETFLSRLIKNARKNIPDIDDITVVSSYDKAKFHKRVSGVDNIIIKDEYDLTGKFSIYDAICLAQDLDNGNLILLADTYFNSNFDFNRENPLSLGLFQTRKPEHFSVIDYYGKIHTKSDKLHQWYHSAWGCFYYTKDVAKHIQKYGLFPHYDVVLQSCIDKFGYQPFDLYDYYDIGTYERYVEWIKSQSLRR